MSLPMQKQRTATPGPQGEARTHTQLGMLETHSQSFFAEQQGSVSAAHHPWSTPEMSDELERPSNSFSLSNIDMDGQHVNVMAASAKFLEQYATHEALYFTHCLRNDADLTRKETADHLTSSCTVNWRNHQVQHTNSFMGGKTHCIGWSATPSEWSAPWRPLGVFTPHIGQETEKRFIQSVRSTRSSCMNNAGHDWNQETYGNTHPSS